MGSWSVRRASTISSTTSWSKQYGGNAFVVDGTGTNITEFRRRRRSASTASWSRGAGRPSTAMASTDARHGFIVTGRPRSTPTSCNTLDTNEAEKLDGDGFVVTGDRPIAHEQQCPVRGMGRRGFRDRRRLGAPTRRTRPRKTKPTDSWSRAAATRSSTTTTLRRTAARGTPSLGAATTSTAMPPRRHTQPQNGEQKRQWLPDRGQRPYLQAATSRRVMMAWDSTCPGPATTSTTNAASRTAVRNGWSGRRTSMAAQKRASGSPFTFPPAGGTVA